MKSEEFFVGYLPIPNKLSRFLLAASLALIAAFGVFAWASGATQDNPGEGNFRFDFGRQTVTGVLETQPYPLVRVTAGNERIPTGHTLMLSAGGKRGLMGRAEPLAGQLVEVSGVLLQRGALDMMQVRGGKAGLGPAEGEDSPQPVEPLGRWRLAGEICDGKCLAGAMRPGRRIAHKACANLCIIGGVPPVFLSSQPVEGADTMLIGGPDGGPMPDALLTHVGAFVRLEGDLERRGDVLVLKVDPETVEVL